MMKPPNHSRGSIVFVNLVLAVACTCVFAQDERRTYVHRTPVRAVTRIPFELNGNEIFLQLRVNGSKPLWFGLDTGAYASVINTTTAQSLGLKMGVNGVATGAGGQVESTNVPDVTFDIGGAILKDLNINALALVSIENSMGHKMDGILGSEFFRRFVVEIDFEKMEISLYEPASFNYRGGGEMLALSFNDNHPYVRARVELQGRDAIDGEFVIDTGSNFALILLPSFIEENKLKASLPPTLKTFGRGVGGEIAMPVGRASRLQLGGITIERPVTAFPQNGMFGRTGKAGNIGSAVLRHFKVTFDYSHSRMMLEPNGRFAEAYEYDMSGLQLVTESPAFNVVRVNRVLPDSPADAAGLRQGDEIITFDGRRVNEFRLAALREMLRKPDRQYALQVRRGAETLNIALRTRRMV
jgi:hypothetical protein